MYDIATALPIMQVERIRSLSESNLSEALYLLIEGEYHAAIKQAEMAVKLLKELESRNA